MTKDFTKSPNVEKISENEWRAWLFNASQFGSVLTLNGTSTDPRVKGGGWNVKDNLQLTELVHEIAQMYLPSVIRRVEILEDDRKIEQKILDDDADAALDRTLTEGKRVYALKNLSATHEVVITQKVYNLLGESSVFKNEVKRVFGEDAVTERHKTDFVAQIIKPLVRAANNILNLNQNDAGRHIAAVIPRYTDPAVYAADNPFSVMDHTSSRSP